MIAQISIVLITIETVATTTTFSLFWKHCFLNTIKYNKPFLNTGLKACKELQFFNDTLLQDILSIIIDISL